MSGAYFFSITAEGYLPFEDSVRFPSVSGLTEKLTVFLIPEKLELDEQIFTLYQSDLRSTWIVCKVWSAEFNARISVRNLLLEGVPEGIYIDEVEFLDGKNILVGLGCAPDLDIVLPIEDVTISALPGAFTGEKDVLALVALGRLRILPDEYEDTQEDTVVVEDQQTVGKRRKQVFFLRETHLPDIWIVLKAQDAAFHQKVSVSDFILGNAPDTLIIEKVLFVNDETVYLGLTGNGKLSETIEGIYIEAGPGAFVSVESGTRIVFLDELRIVPGEAGGSALQPVEIDYADLPDVWIVCQVEKALFLPGISAGDLILRGGPDGIYVKEVRHVSEDTLYVNLACEADLKEATGKITILAKPSGHKDGTKDDIVIDSFVINLSK